MNLNPGVCPITGTGNLPIPPKGVWALQIPHKNGVWYFNEGETKIRGLFYCIINLWGNNYPKDKSEKEIIEELLYEGNLILKNGWYFFRIPIHQNKRSPDNFPEHIKDAVKAIILRVWQM